MASQSSNIGNSRRSACLQVLMADSQPGPQVSNAEHSSGDEWDCSSTSSTDDLLHTLKHSRENRGPQMVRSVIASRKHRPPPTEGDAFFFGGGYKCPSLSHVDGSPCTVMQLCDLAFVSAIGAVVAVSRNSYIVPADKLQSYLRSKCSHKFTLGNLVISSSQWKLIVNYILVAYGIDTKQSSVTLRNSLPTQLPAPIPLQMTKVSYYFL